MKRREFIFAPGGAAAWPLAAHAQQAERLRRIGILMSLAPEDAEAQAYVSAFKRALAIKGWNEGQSLRFEERWAHGDTERLRTLAAELTSLRPDLILVVGTPALAAQQRQAGTVPAVFVQVADPVGGGFVASLSRPGGHVTGFTNYEYSMGGKWLEILTEVAPGLKRVLIILNPANSGSLGLLKSIKSAAQPLGISIEEALIKDARSIKLAIDGFARESNGGLITMPDLVTAVHRDLIVSMAKARNLPGIYPFRSFAVSGGLLSYGIDVVDVFRRAASYADMILRGANPGELPVQQPIKFELVINLKTAKALGLDVSLQLQQRADEVIE